MLIGETTPWVGDPTAAVTAAEVTAATVASAGVNTAVSTTLEATVGSHVHLATNGVTVVVATLSQPAIDLPSAIYATVPAELVVATRVSGKTFTTAFDPPVKVMVAASAATAGAIPAIPNAAITAVAIILRIFCSFYFGFRAITL
jgi:hypothetical protein